MTKLLFRQDAYQETAIGSLLEVNAEGGLIFDQTIFYPIGGGQPSDLGVLSNEAQTLKVREVRKGTNDKVVVYVEEATDKLKLGETFEQKLDWPLRYGHMRVHTALHLLSVVIPLGVTGGSIGSVKGRLDFEMPEPLENKELIEDQLNDLIMRDLKVTESWITDEELERNPSLVKTMRVKPPTGQGQVRLVRIGTEAEEIDLQPCGGTHVKSTIEIGRIRLGKVENKGKSNRRIHLHLEN
ncbi:MAG: alanyl-tRNA editing protein [Paracoccaceae bacterium]|jgi:misacylated tRNA(Ala) deacylase|tara:strand:+ start:490 stop:1209 length:720 start_codon:yes stop_codon:yes gene_type:complete